MLKTKRIRHSSTIITSVLFSMANFLLPADVSAAVSPKEMKKIEAAVPDEATAKPLKPRKLLVFSLVGGNHTATPYEAKALELMGAKTAAFDVVHETDPSVFKAENLEPFDAVCFNNSNRLRCFNDPVLRQGLLEFVFYCSLGHEHDVFWNPAVLRHYLDGIQFALGDLPVDTTPSAALSLQSAREVEAACRRPSRQCQEPGK